LDLVIFVKGVNFGYVLLGGVIISDVIYEMFCECLYFGGLIYFGYLLVCVSVVVMINVMIDECVVENVVCIGM